MPEVHFGVPVIEDRVLYDLTDIKRDVLNDVIVEQCPGYCHLAYIRRRNETRGDEMVPHLRDTYAECLALKCTACPSLFNFYSPWSLVSILRISR